MGKKRKRLQMLESGTNKNCFKNSAIQYKEQMPAPTKLADNFMVCQNLIASDPPNVFLTIS